MFLRTEFNYDVDKASLESGLVCDDLSLAQQSMLEETDINTIVRRFGVTGHLPQNIRVPEYGDFTGVYDYQSAIHAIQAADQSFMSMSADVRARFGNDPGAFVAFCSDPSNLQEMRKLGLAVEASSVASVSTDATGEANKP